MENIQVFKPNMQTEAILEQIRIALDSGWIGLGKKVEEFEQKLEDNIGSKFVCLNSGTSALHLAVKSLGLKNCNVITTPLTFVSTNHALLYENCEPIFCDVDKYSGNADPESIAKILQTHDNVKAIVVVHLGGFPCDMEKINSIAHTHGIPVIEDCAHAFGSLYKNLYRVGNTDNICCWSFHAVKNLPVGDGGAISCKDNFIIHNIKKLRRLGIDKDTISRTNNGSYAFDYMVEDVGYKYHMNDLTAIVGLEQLKTVFSDNRKRREIATAYRSKLRFNVIFPNTDSIFLSSCHFYPIHFLSNRDKLYQHLCSKGIYCGMHYKPNYKYPMYDFRYRENNCENAEWYYKHELTLPIYPNLTQEELEYIVKEVNECMY